MDGESAARYIKGTNGKNTNTPIVAVSAYSGADPSENSNVFAASLSKPVQKTDLIGEWSSLSFRFQKFNNFETTVVMRQLGFRTSTMRHGPGHPRVTTSTASFS